MHDRAFCAKTQINGDDYSTVGLHALMIHNSNKTGNKATSELASLTEVMQKYDTDN